MIAWNADTGMEWSDAELNELGNERTRVRLITIPLF